MPSFSSAMVRDLNPAPRSLGKTLLRGSFRQPIILRRVEPCQTSRLTSRLSWHCHKLPASIKIQSRTPRRIFSVQGSAIGMASLRASSAVRLLRGASHTRSILPAARRFESSIPLIQKEELPLTTPRHNVPEYDVHTDKATSCVYTLAELSVEVIANTFVGPSPRYPSV